MTTDARDAQSVADDGFHEIHLSGKQLVFLFMVTTVVSVFIFLCGVLVGRGVRNDVADQVVAGQALNEPAAESQPVPSGAAPDVPQDSAAAAPGPTTLEPGATMYTDLLDAPEPPVEKLDKAAVSPTKAAPTTAAPPKAATPPRAATPETAPPPAEPTKAKEPAKASAPVVRAEPAPKPPAPAAAARTPKRGITVQVAAVRRRAEADVIANRLKKNGFDAYVVEPDAAARMYRVRVGSYADASEAERVADRLRREEKLKPWVIR